MQRLIHILDQRTSPLRLFFRDDDAGWQQNRLDDLLGVFTDYETPIDLAVIPAALTTDGAARLHGWRTRHPAVALHQHGYAHLNHEPADTRKCEFGPSRPLDRQCADIAMGRDRLRAMLDSIDPIFTPPWNRCVPDILARLPRLGFAAFSDDGKASTQGTRLAHLPIALDWDRQRAAKTLEGALGDLLISAESTAGIMLHHATMDASALSQLRQFLNVVHSCGVVELILMRDLVEPVSCTR